MEDTTARLALRRTFRSSSTTEVSDFETSETRRGTLRPALVALVVSSLGVLGAGGVAMAAAASSDEQAKTSLITDRDAPDNSKAAPQDIALDANQQAAAQARGNQQRRGADSGGLEQFGQRGTTPNRNGVRSALNSQLVNTKGSQRNQNIQETSDAVASAKARAEAAERERLMDADVAKVKKEAARIKEEKRKAAELLKQVKDAAGKNPQTPVQDGAGKPISPEDLKNISQGGASLPLKPGTFSLGAYFGKTGSWARYHTGQDFPAPTGTPVYAASSGVVGGDMSARGWAGPYYVTIHHAGGGSTLYAHLSARVVSAGQTVKAGQLIGYVGDEGRSFGSHLHFEYYPAGTTPGDVYSASDPMVWLRSLGLNI